MLFHTRKFEKDLTILFKFLDIRSHNAKLVDTVAEHVGRA